MSHLIWIPSLQDYRRFKELSVKSLHSLFKSGDDVEFVYLINSILKELAQEHLDFNNLTLLDKYIMALYIRMLSVGTDIEFTLNCPNCGVEFNHRLDLNDIIEKNLAVLDRSYKTTIVANPYTFTCDIPSIAKDYEFLKFKKTLDIKEDSVDNIYAFNLFSHIKSFVLGGVEVDLSKYDVSQCIQILQEIPTKQIQTIAKGFMEPLSKTFTPNILNIPCKTEKCDPFKFDLNVQNINEAIKILYQGNPTSLLQEVYYLSKYANIPPEYSNTISPKEKEMFLRFLIDDKKKEQEAMDSQNKAKGPAIGNFDAAEHGFDLPESPSEFS